MGQIAIWGAGDQGRILESYIHELGLIKKKECLIQSKFPGCGNRAISSNWRISLEISRLMMSLSLELVESWDLQDFRLLSDCRN